MRNVLYLLQYSLQALKAGNMLLINLSYSFTIEDFVDDHNLVIYTYRK